MERDAHRFASVFGQRDVRKALLLTHRMYEDLRTVIRAGIIQHLAGVDFEVMEEARKSEIINDYCTDPAKNRKVDRKLWKGMPPVWEIVNKLIEHNIRAEIWPRLPKPAPVSAADLRLEIAEWLTYAEEYLSDESNSEEQNYKRSLEELDEWLTKRSSRFRASKPIAVAVVDDGFRLTRCPDPLWSSEHASVRVNSVRVTTSERLEEGRKRLAKTSARRLYAAIEGNFSRGAIEHSRLECGRLLRALLTMASDLEKPTAAHLGPTELPEIGGEVLSKHGTMIGRWLQSYFSAKPERRTVTRQIRNALQLVVESIHQTNDAISVATGCAALEALACRGGAITEILSANVATLLEPDRYQRLNAIQKIKDLYDRRSRILHGDSMDCAPEDRHWVRAICAHLLRAIFEWSDFRGRIDDKQDSIDDFFKEVESARVAGDALVTCVESPLCRYWRKQL